MQNPGKRYLLAILVTGLIIGGNNVNAQSGITIDASQQMTTFDFYDSMGETDDSYSPIYSGAYNVGYSYFLDFGMYFNASVGMRNAGSSMTYDATDLRWDFQYGQGKLGLGYAYNMGRFSPYLGVSGYYSMLLTANQQINDPMRENKDYDLMGAGLIAEDDFGLYITPGVRIAASDFISVYTELGYLMGMQNIETGTGEQEAYNTGYSITLGLSFTIQSIN